MTLASTSPLSTARLIASDIKLAHSVFALPFAILGACMAAIQGFFILDFGFDFEHQHSPTRLDLARHAHLPGKIALIILAMVFARTVAMLANRLLDRHIDRHNPRTANRAIPSGRLPARTALLVLVLCAVAFAGVCACFGWLYENWLPLQLAPLVLVWISAYGLLKRWTWLCHLYLGISLAFSPIAAAIAVNPDALRHQTSLYLLSAMVLFWVAGFDIIYALQDIEVDRQQNLFSIPSRFGAAAALRISRVLHALALACLVAAGLVDPRFGALFFIGIAIVAVLLIYEHLTIARWGSTKMALAFFTLNGVISCVLGILGVIDVLVL